LKCVEIGNSNVVSGKKSHSGRLAMETFHKKVKGLDMLHEDAEPTKSMSVRALLDDSSKSKAGQGEYITYRSCIPALNEEKLSVIGFEVRDVVIIFSYDYGCWSEKLLLQPLPCTLCCNTKCDEFPF